MIQGGKISQDIAQNLPHFSENCFTRVQPQGQERGKGVQQISQRLSRERDSRSSQKKREGGKGGGQLLGGEEGAELAEKERDNENRVGGVHSREVWDHGHQEIVSY